MQNMYTSLYIELKQQQSKHITKHSCIKPHIHNK